MRESDIERKLVKAVKEKGGLCLKQTTTTFDGIPDRLVLLPGGKSAFVELKAPGKQPRPLQVKRMKQLTDLGQKCFVVDNVEMIGDVLDEIQST